MTPAPTRTPQDARFMKQSAAGTRETKRWDRAASPPIEGRHYGVLITLFALAALPGWWFWSTGRVISLMIALLFALPLTIALGREAYGCALIAAASRAWVRGGIKCLVVHSNSPLWADHIRTKWLPRTGKAAVLLNWSERATWRPSLSVRVFNHFCGRTHDFNPAVVVFRGFRRPLVFRFFYAFQEAKHGRTRYLESLERDLFAALDC